MPGIMTGPGYQSERGQDGHRLDHAEGRSRPLEADQREPQPKVVPPRDGHRVDHVAAAEAGGTTRTGIMNRRLFAVETIVNESNVEKILTMYAHSLWRALFLRNLSGEVADRLTNAKQ